MRRRAGLAMAVVVLAVPASAGAATPAETAKRLRCTAKKAAPVRLDFTVDGQATYAMLARPASAPRALVTYDHGYGDLPGGAADRRNLALIAQRLGAIVVAPVYRGTVEIDPETSRGAPLLAGARDTVALLELLRASCGDKPAIAVGLSMGGTIAGLAAIQSGEYELWAGVNPMQETATASLASRAAGATEFADDLDAEAGGSPLEQPEAFRERSLAQRHGELAASGIRAAVIVDAMGDATGAQLQTNLLQPLLLADGLPVHREIRVVRDADAPPEGDFAAALLGESSPFTGHLGLTSVRAAVDRIAALLDAGTLARR